MAQMSTLERNAPSPKLRSGQRAAEVVEGKVAPQQNEQKQQQTRKVRSSLFYTYIATATMYKIPWSLGFVFAYLNRGSYPYAAVAHSRRIKNALLCVITFQCSNIFCLFDASSWIECSTIAIGAGICAAATSQEREGNHIADA